MIKPDFLRSGDTVGVISPCFNVPCEEKEIIEKALTDRKFKIKYGKYLFCTDDCYCATAEERAEDLNNAVLDKDIKMIMFDGGEVGNELLPLIDYESIKKHPKIFCSYSDGTSILNAISANCGLVTFYGQSWRGAMYSEYNKYWFNSVLCCGKIPEYRSAKGLVSLHGGVADGFLIGGYLLNFSLLMGNPYFKFNRSHNHILFLEDNIAFNSAPAVSRYLSNIEQSEFFRTVKGVIIGHYCVDSSPDFNHVIKKFADKWNMPFIKCEDFGHGEFQAIYPIGVKVTLDADNKQIILKESLKL